MDLTTKKILIIDLKTATYEVKNFGDLQKYIGGVGLGLKLLDTYFELDPIIISIGPLNGFFPFASKASVVLDDGGVIEDLYLGGTLSSRLKFTGVDALVICNTSATPVVLDILNSSVGFKSADLDLGSLGLPGRRSVLGFFENKALLDKYFTTSEYFLEKKLAKKNLAGIVLTGTETFIPRNMDKFEEIYNSILARKSDLYVPESTNPSCTNCPMGCDKSKIGELGGNVLIHSLVGCQYAEKIYSDVGIVFSCLNVLGYDYTHEDIENLPSLIEQTLKKLN